MQYVHEYFLSNHANTAVPLMKVQVKFQINPKIFQLEVSSELTFLSMFIDKIIPKNVLFTPRY